MQNDIVAAKKKTRLPYIDTAKGLLIVFMVMGHIVILAKDVTNVSYMEFITQINVLFVPYYMQTFFFITGYCSSFNKEFKTFFVANAKSLLIPFITFGVLNQLIRWIFFHENFFFCVELGKEFFFLVELYWFLAALFIAKIIYFSITKLTTNMWIGGGIIMLLFFCAVYLNGRHVHSYNYFHWHNALCNLPFLWIGQVFRNFRISNNFEKWENLFVPLYIILVLVFNILQLDIPSYSHYPHFYWQQTHCYFIFAFVGSMMIIAISKKLPSNRILTFFGKNSLTVYGLHFSVLGLFQLCLVHILSPSNHYAALVFYILSLIVTLIITFWLCLLFQRKPFRYLIGNF